MRFPCGSTAAFAVAVLLLLLVPAATGAVDPASESTGYIQVSSHPPGATVYVNMARMSGVTPLTVPVPAGEPVEVVVNLYGYEAARQTVTVQPGQTLPLAFELQLLSGGGQLDTATPGSGRSGATPGAPGVTVTTPIWVEETPLPASAALFALAGAGLLARRRR